MRAKTIIAIMYIMHICACTITDEPLLSEGIEPELMEEGKAISDEALSQSIQNTELMLKKYTGGTPLVLPLIYESDPGVFIMPVSFDSTMHVDCTYLVDNSNPDIDFDGNRDIYIIDSIYYVDDAERPFRVVVSRGNIHKTYCIDSFQYREIQKINRKTYGFPVNTTIPEVIYSGASK